MDDNRSHYLIKHIPLAFDTYISTIPHMYILHTTTELNEIIAIIFGITKKIWRLPLPFLTIGYVATVFPEMRMKM